MTNKTMWIAALGLSALVLGTTMQPATVWAQEGAKRQGRNADRDQAPLAGRIGKGTLQGMAFGDNATITVKTNEGETLVLSWSTAKFHCDKADATASSFAVKNPTGSPITILYAQAQGKVSLREAWDLASWNNELNNHKGIKTGGITQLTNRVLTTLSYRFALTKDTLWVKNGKAASREDFNSRDTVFIKGDTSTGLPVALTVADTEAGANMTALDLAAPGGEIKPRPKGNNRPASTGTGNSRPTSTGTGNAYTVRVFLKITDASDNAGEAGAVAAQITGGDNKVECYGELRANGQKVWEIVRKDAEKNRKGTGETITILPTEDSGLRNGSTWRVTGSTLSLTGFLTDDDNLTANDLLYSWSLNLNLAELAGQGEKVYRSSTSKAELHVTVTR